MSFKLTDSKILRVNLTKGKCSVENLDLSLVKKFLGGRGLGTKILSDEVKPDIDPLAPENKIIFINGLLSGVTAPTSGRYMVVTKGPLTGTVACSNSGGFFGAELRKAGYMMIIIEGKSKKPVFLAIQDEKVEIKDAGDLWGLTTHETTHKLQYHFKRHHSRVACIGPAGENLSRIASIMNDRDRAAGRSGVGAVMGSKKLKAIIVRGSSKIELEHEKEFKRLVRNKNKILRKDSVTGEGLPALGTKVLDSIINASGLYPTENFQYATFKGIEEVSGEALVSKKYFKRKKACFACPIACGRDTALPDGSKGEGPEYESGWAFGADCGVNDLIAITKANFMCNELGLDTISAGATIAAAMELYEKGYIPKEDLKDAVEPRFGSSEAVVYYTRAMAYREGFGDKMSEGSYRLAEAYGHPELSMSVKRQELPAYDPRGVQGQALQYATSNRGGCHVRGYLISPEILGVPEKLDTQTTEGKAGWVKAFQDTTAVIDSLGVCLFTSFALNLDDYCELANAATEFKFTSEELLKAGERIWNLERQFNLAAGIKPDEDTLPDRFLKEPLPDGPQKGAVVKLDQMLPEYYQERGWDENGLITPKKLKELGL